MTTIKVFNKWPTEGIEVEDPSLKRYITLTPRIVPRSGARYAGKRFHKSKVFIVERLMNKIMIPGHKAKKHYRTSGHLTGKSQRAYKHTYDALAIIEKQTKENPIKVLVRAIENAAPREEIITIEYGGAAYPKAVECAPQRRIDIALRYFVQGAFAKSFNSRVSFNSALASEIVAAYQLDLKSTAISKKNDQERQADAAR